MIKNEAFHIKYLTDGFQSTFYWNDVAYLSSFTKNNKNQELKYHINIHMKFVTTPIEITFDHLDSMSQYYSTLKEEFEKSRGF